MGVNDWVHDEGEVQRSVEAITELFRSNPLLGIYVYCIAEFCVQRSQSVLNFHTESDTKGYILPVYWKTHYTERRCSKTILVILNIGCPYGFSVRPGGYWFITL